MLLSITAVFAGLIGAVQQDPAATAFALQLPPGPAARAWAGVGPRTQPAPLSKALRTIAAQGPALWEQPATWELWALRLEALRRLRQKPPAPGSPQDHSRSAAHADLALLAAAQGRGRDAWVHFAALTDSPEQAARVAAHLIPGVPLSAELGAGGMPTDLPDGVHLRPILPEYPADDPSADLAWRKAQVHGLPIGSALVDLRLIVEANGVEFEFTHASGPKVRVLGSIPEPRDYTFRFAYSDWTKVDQPLAALPVELMPGGEEPHVLYGRVSPSPVPWPTPKPGHLSSELARHGIWLVIDPGDPEAELWAAAAQAIGRLLQVPAGVRPPAPRSAGLRPGQELEVPDDEARAPRSRADFGRYLADSVGAHAQLSQ